MGNPMMKCGHAANSHDKDGNPACVICVGIAPGATEIDAAPDLSGRKALCAYRVMGKNGQPGDHEPVPSSTELAFFERKPKEPYDRYYCGCHGWD